MAKILRTNMFHECDFESERSLTMDSAFLIYTKDTQKWWKIYNGTFIEVLKENLQGVIGVPIDVVFNNEKVKNVSFGITYLSIPRVNFTLGANQSSVPFKTNTTTSGCTINFATKYTGIVEVTVTKV